MQSIPYKWNNTVAVEHRRMIVLNKKGDFIKLENYKWNTLLCHLCELFTKIIAKHMNGKLDFYQSTEHVDLRKSCKTNFHLQAIKVLIEKFMVYNRS